MPLSLGGTSDVVNLALACRSCNVLKSNHLAGQLADGTSGRLFNPRTDIWEDHFRFDASDIRICGISSIGMATIDRLQLNSDAQIAARELWVKLEIFP